MRSNRRRRVLMIVHASFPQDVRVVREARALVDAGWEVDVLATTESLQPRRETVGGADVHRLGVEHRRGAGTVAMLVEYTRFTVLAVWQAARLMTKRRYAVVQVHNPPDFLVVATLWPRLLGARVILDVHDLAPDMFAMRFEGRRGAALADRLLRAIEHVAVRFADGVITVHEPYRRELIRRGSDPDSTVVVMNAVDERLLPQGELPVSHGFRAVYHGSVTPHYGVHLLVEATVRARAAVDGFRAEVYGAGDAVPALRALADQLGVADAVTIDGHALSQEDVLHRVAGAQAGVIPNLDTRLNQYALSTKLFEYVALRIPVVCSGLPTLREHFADDEVLFFRAGDADDLAAALTSIAEDPAAAGERAERAARRASGYSWDENAKRLVATFDRAWRH